MDDSQSTWWQGADRRWRKGTPPAGWRQASDGRWYPPPDQDPTEQIPAIEPRAAAGGATAATPGLTAHAARRRSAGGQAGGRDRGPSHTALGRRPVPDDDRPEWFRIAVAAAAAVLALSVLGVIVSGAGGGSGASDEPAGRDPDGADAALAAGTSTTSHPVDGSSTTTAPTTEPPVTDPPTPPTTERRGRPPSTTTTTEPTTTTTECREPDPTHPRRCCDRDRPPCNN